jgi:hypothetical protein
MKTVDGQLENPFAKNGAGTGSAVLPSRARDYRWLQVAVPIFIFAVYAILPTKNYYWDGISFAQDIEKAGRPGSPSFWFSLIRANHLVYDSIGYPVWAGLCRLGFPVRALGVLQAINMFFAAVCAWVLQRTLLRITNSLYLSTSLALLCAFSAVFWRFATDADAYIPSVLFLVMSFHVLCASSKNRPLLVGMLHGGAMLIHQLAIFFFPAAAIGVFLKGGRRSLFHYCAAATIVTLPLYYTGYWLQQQELDPRHFVSWLTTHSSEVTFTFNVPKNLVISVMSYPRLFFGGTGHFLQFFGPFMFAVLFLFAAALVALLLRVWRHRDELPFLFRKPELTLSLKVAAVWLAVYVVFLFFWLPWNTFYKLFCLPPIIVIFAHLLMQYRGPRRYRLLLFVTTLALANLAFYIFPYSRPDYNQALRFARRMSNVWVGSTVVYYGVFTTDNWFIRYFNPQTTWKEITPAKGVAEFPEDAQRELAAGHEVWVDSTAAAALATRWANITADFDLSQQDNSPRHPIRFYRWKPRGQLLASP